MFVLQNINSLTHNSLPQILSRGLNVQTSDIELVHSLDQFKIFDQGAQAVSGDTKFGCRNGIGGGGNVTRFTFYANSQRRPESGYSVYPIIYIMVII